MYKLLYIWSKCLKKMRGSAIKSSVVDKSATIEAGSHVINSSIGKYSYCGYDCQIINARIGNFCSIADNVRIGGAEHPIDWVSTSCVFYRGRDSIRVKFSEFDRPPGKKIIIGHDVWIGANVLIKQGITIGTGSIIGMGAIVTKDVPPYAIVVGNPARILRYRFEESVCSRLLKSGWWLMDGDILRKCAMQIRDVVAFLTEVESIKSDKVKDVVG